MERRRSRVEACLARQIVLTHWERRKHGDAQVSRLLAKRRLVPHPDLPAPPFQLSTKTTLVGSDVLKLEYVVIGRIAELSLPAPAVGERTVGLWRHTCFEAFIRLSDRRSYVEYNFSPSTQWASFRFEGHRKGMQPAMDLPGPDIYAEVTGDDRFALTAWLELTPLASADTRALALSAVVEERGGNKSYWALAHPPGPPDFHHEDCFALELPAARPA